MPLCDDVTLYCASEALSPLRVTLNPSGENIATVVVERRSKIRVRRSLSGIAIWALEGSGRFFFASTEAHFEVELRVNSPAVIVRPNGTIFDVAYDGQARQSTVRVEEGSVEVTPTYPPVDPSDLSTLQPRAAPLTLHAGEAVVVGSDTIGSVTLLCLAGQCDDGDACTADTCSPTACGHASASGFDAVCSACRGGLGSRACTDQPVPTTVGKRFALACTLRDQAGARTPKAAQKLLRRAKKNLKSAAAGAKKAAMKHKHAISSDCADTIVGVLHGS
jgi:hypothetical protein